MAREFPHQTVQPLATTETLTPVETRVAADFNSVATRFNRGDSGLHLTLEGAHSYIPNFAAMLLANAVDQEQTEGQENGLFTRLQRAILTKWGENRERALNNQPQVSGVTRIFELTEFVGLERLLAHQVKVRIDKVRASEHFKWLPESELLDNVIATLITKQLPRLFHDEHLLFEDAVAMNATAVDPEGLLRVLDDVNTRHMERLQQPPTRRATPPTA